MKKALYVKLFAGEFGHELMRWQGCVRKIAKQYNYYVVVECKAGHELLYEDFADCIIRYEIIRADVVNCSIFKGKTLRLDNSPYLSDYKVKIIQPCIEICDKQKNQTFVPLGKPNADLKYDIIIHARNDSRVIKYGNRNWSLENWIAVVNKLKDKKIVSIGTCSSSFHVPGTKDLRDVPLKELANVLYNSKLCVGPSSGPMHFASLCSCKHLVWSVKGPRGFRVGGGAETMKERYGYSWNPFMSEVKVIDKWDWDPPVNVVFKNIMEMLNG